MAQFGVIPCPPNCALVILTIHAFIPDTNPSGYISFATDWIKPAKPVILLGYSLFGHYYTSSVVDKPMSNCNSYIEVTQGALHDTKLEVSGGNLSPYAVGSFYTFDDNYIPLFAGQFDIAPVVMSNFRILLNFYDANSANKNRAIQFMGIFETNK